MKKIIIGLSVIVLLAWAQLYIAGGINGLTMISIPLTIFLGVTALERLTETGEDKPTK